MAYTKYKEITIDNTKVSGTTNLTNLTNFLFPYKITDNDLRTTANGGFVENTNGYDIILSTTTASDGKGGF